MTKVKICKGNLKQILHKPDKSNRNSVLKVPKITKIEENVTILKSVLLKHINFALRDS